MAHNQHRSILKRILHAPVYLYPLGLGRLLGKRFLLLTHWGRRTGLRHQTILEVMEYRDAGGNKKTPEIIVMSGFGRNAGWLRNIEASPAAEITIQSQHFNAAHRFLDEDEAIAVVHNYERKNRFIAPIVRSVLSRLLGWRYGGSESDHRRLVAQLPLIAFWPRS